MIKPTLDGVDLGQGLLVLAWAYCNQKYHKAAIKIDDYFMNFISFFLFYKNFGVENWNIGCKNLHLAVHVSEER